MSKSTLDIVRLDIILHLIRQNSMSRFKRTLPNVDDHWCLVLGISIIHKEYGTLNLTGVLSWCSLFEGQVHHGSTWKYKDEYILQSEIHTRHWWVLSFLNVSGVLSFLNDRIRWFSSYKRSLGNYRIKKRPAQQYPSFTPKSFQDTFAGHLSIFLENEKKRICNKLVGKTNIFFPFTISFGVS